LDDSPYPEEYFSSQILKPSLDDSPYPEELLSLGILPIRLSKSTLKSQISDFKFQNHQHGIGGGEGTRTPDPMVANHVLCQLSYTPFEISNFRFQIPKFNPFWNLRYEI
jgi:hypothetical protein